MLASLPMYDFPEIREATNAFWAALARAYGVKGDLTRDEDWTAAWRSPDLVFSQTCGYPFTHEFAGRLTYVATPHYDADGCEGANYCSIIFAREAVPLDVFRGRIAAYNTDDSMSGMLALKLVFAPLAGATPFFSTAKKTGSHVASLSSVQSGEADVCAIDCVTVALLRKYRPSALEGLFEIARSPSVPALPYVTRGGAVARLRIALEDVFTNHVLHAVRDALLLRKISVLKEDDYKVIVKEELAASSSQVFPPI